MRDVSEGQIWIGHAGDLRDPGLLDTHSIDALVHVALEERPPTFSRTRLCCHVPLLDGANDPGMLAAALELTASLIRHRVPTLVCCSAGMSRSPVITAGAIALATQVNPADCLQRITAGHPHDVSPALWDAVLAYVNQRDENESIRRNAIA